MPYQLSGQLVVKNSATSEHAAGAGAAVGGGAFVTRISSADAADAHAAPATPSIIAVETLNFFISPPFAPSGPKTNKQTKYSTHPKDNYLKAIFRKRGKNVTCFLQRSPRDK